MVAGWIEIKEGQRPEFEMDSGFFCLGRNDRRPYLSGDVQEIQNVAETYQNFLMQKYRMEDIPVRSGIPSLHQSSKAEVEKIDAVEGN